MNQAWLDEIKWTDDGLVPAIAQDEKTGKVLMFAWMNRASLAETMSTKRAVYWSRSRQKLWRKGEASGHEQHVKSMRIDCDADVLLMKIEQRGGIACHTGRESCFYKEWQAEQWQAVDPVLKDPKEIYAASGSTKNSE